MRKWRVNNSFVHGMVGVLAVLGLGFGLRFLGQVLTPLIGYELAVVVATPILVFCGILCAGVILRAARGGYPDPEDTYAPWP
jgi:hypothetical protein